MNRRSKHDTTKVGRPTIASQFLGSKVTPHDLKMTMEVNGFLNIDSLSEKCVNCARDLKNPGNGLSKSPVSDARISAFHYTENAKQLQKTVVEGLGEVFKHNWLKLDKDGQDFPMIMCYNCSISFSMLYQAYVDFKGKQTHGSALRVITEVMDALFGKYETSSLYETIVRKILLPTKRKPQKVANAAVNKRRVPNDPVQIVGPWKMVPEVAKVARVATLTAATTPSQLVSTTEPSGPRGSTGQVQSTRIIPKSSPILAKLQNGKNVAVIPQSEGIIKLGDKLFRVVRKEAIPAKKMSQTSSIVKSPSDVRKYVCSVCDKDFPSEFRLECHRNYCRNPTEAIQKLAQCEVCGMNFASAHGMITHHRAAHLDKTKFKCTHQQCYRAYGTREALDKHVEAHKQPESLEEISVDNEHCGMSKLISNDLATAFSEQQQKSSHSRNNQITSNTEGINPGVVNIKEEEMWGSFDQGDFILG